MTAVGALLHLGDEPIEGVLATWHALDQAGCATIYVTGDFTLCAAIVAQTRWVRVCCLSPPRGPRHVAESSRTLQYLSGGRFVLGLGPLDDDTGPFGAVTAAEHLAEEATALVPSLPIVVYGQGTGPLRLAAELADSWLTDAAQVRSRSPREMAAEHCKGLGRHKPLRCASLLPPAGPLDAPPHADEVVRALHRPLASADDAAAWLEEGPIEPASPA